MEHIGTYLVAPGDLSVVALQVGYLLLMLLFEQFGQFRREHLHSHFLILMLAAFILAGDDDARGDVRDAHGGIRLVDVLAARAARAVRVCLQILRIDFHVDAFLNFRHDVYGGKRRMPPARGIERRDAHKAVHALFAFRYP